MSKRPKVMVVMGTRPEAIKMAPVLDALARSTVLDHCLCVTGQHRDMLDQVLEIFEIRINVVISMRRMLPRLPLNLHLFLRRVVHEGLALLY